MDNSPIIVVSGPRGRGKSTWCIGHIANLPRVLVLDSMGEYPFPVIWTLDELLQWIDRGGGRTNFRVSVRTPSADADEVFRAAWALAPCVIVAEEADRYRKGHQCIPGLSYIVEYGRHSGLGLIALTRRPARIPRDLTANASRAIVFKTVEPADLSYWREFLPQGANPAALSGHAYIDADLWRATYSIHGPTDPTEEQEQPPEEPQAPQQAPEPPEPTEEPPAPEEPSEAA